MLLGEILIDGVFIAALLTGVACLGYVLYAMIVERHLLHTRRALVVDRAFGAVTRSASSPVTASPAARDHWRRSAGSPALPHSRG